MSNRMNRPGRVLAAALIVAVLGAGAIVFAVVRGGEEAAPQSGFCWGTLSAADVATLSPKPHERYESYEDPVRNTPSSDCRVYGDDLKHAEFYLKISGVSDDVNVWRTADEVAAESPFRVPISGAPGWTNKTYAGVLLPPSCARGLGVSGRPYVQLNREDERESGWQEGESQKRMADVLMTSATNLAKRLGCATTSYSPAAEAPRLLAPRPVDPAQACGLPGFAPLKPPGGGLQEYVTPGDLRLWSCAIAPTGDEHALRYLTVTQDPILVGAHRPAAGGHGDEVLLTCGGTPTLLQFGSPFTSPGAEPGVAAEALRSDAEIFAGFRDAVSRQAHCR
ncbi:hypothetical protein [Streptomyces sp. NPDC096339]|uniref:hypothetical protein n=1 Tax=Streptomyces sp. NPDC096339 TaxID=3366086 RepID=UPI0037F65C33